MSTLLFILAMTNDKGITKFHKKFMKNKLEV